MLVTTGTKSESKKYKAAKLGFVLWRNCRKASVIARGALGLPSSHILDTRVHLARPFLLSLDLMSLLRLILYWVAGDGCVKYVTYQYQDGIKRLRFESISLLARDTEIMPLLKEALDSHGLEDCSATLVLGSGMNELVLKNRAILKEYHLLCVIWKLPTAAIL